MKHRWTNQTVVHVTTVHSPLDTRIFWKMCTTLAEHGFDVLLVARHPKPETINGVRIVPLPGGASKSRWLRFVRSLLDAARATFSCPRSLVHFHDPELIPLGVALRLLGRPVLYDAHEDLPRQTLTKEYIPRWLRPAVAGVCSVIEGVGVRCFSGVVAATPTIARRFPSRKTVLVQNFPIREELTGSGGGLPYSDRPPDFAYVGGIEEIRGVREMVQAIGRVAHGGARLRLAGAFEPKGLRQEVETLPGWQKAEFLGWRSRAQVADLLGRVRAGLVLFHPAPNHVSAQPNKLFEYMSAGIPVIASDFPLWRELVQGTGCGLLANPLDVADIAQAMDRILGDPEEARAMGERGRKAVEEKYNWQPESERLLEFYGKFLSPPAG